MGLPTAISVNSEQQINDNKKPHIIAASAICLSAAYIAVALRFVARKRGRNSLEADDYTMLVALFFTSIFVVTVLIGVHYGLGRHWIFVTNGTAYSKDILALTVLYNPAIATTKFSILFLYRRTFPIRSFVIVLWCVGAFVAAYSITAALVNLFQCLPVRAEWNPGLQPRCVNLRIELIILSSINAVTDFIILALPMPLIWGLHTSRSRKIQVSCTFLLGGFVCAVSIIRVPYVSQVLSTDASWVDSNGVIWSVVETCIAVVSACLPTLRILIKHPANRASAREKYEASYKPKIIKNLDSIKISTLDSPRSQNISLERQEAGEERAFSRLSDGY